MSTKREFSQTYQEVVGLVKQLKNSNDKLNKSIGVQSDRAILSQIRADQNFLDDITKRVDSLINKLEISYLDPDTARRIGTVKQQYRIQKDRRQHLLQSIQMEEKESSPMKNQMNERKEYEQVISHLEPVKKREKGDNQSLSTQRSQIHSNERQKQEQIYDFDYELETKLMHEKNRAIDEASRSILSAHSILQETLMMTVQQGDHVEIISDSIFTSLENTKESNRNLQEANEHQRRARGKYVFVSVFLVFVVVAALLFIFL